MFEAGLELPVRCFAFDRSGGFWCFDDQDVLRRFDLKQGTVERFKEPLPLPGVRALAPSPAGDQILVTAAEACAVIRDPFGDPEVELLGVEGIATAAFDPSGKYLALAHTEEGLLVVDGLTMDPVWGEEFIASQLPVLRFSTEGLPRVAVNTCEAVQVYELATGQRLHRIELKDDALFAYASDPGFDVWMMSGECGAKLYRVTEGKEPGAYDFVVLPRPPGARALGLLYEARDRYMTTNSDGSLYRIIEGEGFVMYEHPSKGDTKPVSASLIETSADQGHLATFWGDGMVRLHRI